MKGPIIRYAHRTEEWHAGITNLERFRGDPERKMSGSLEVRNSRTRARVADSSSITMQRRFRPDSLLLMKGAVSPSSCSAS